MKNKITVYIFAIILCVATFACWFKPDTAFSQSERRPLAQKPELTLQTVFSGEFMDAFEEYTTDQYPKRDVLRTIKALFVKHVFNKQDNNGLFVAEGHISKIEYPQNQQMLDNAQKKFDYLYNSYIKGSDSNVYLCVVPDKNMFIVPQNDIVCMDYNNFINDFKNRFEYMTYIDVSSLLTSDDYYKTDSHWKQEKITGVAKHIASKMGANADAQYKEITLDIPFNGVYKGQSALPFKADAITYLTNDILENCEVTYFDTGKPVKGDMYNMEKANGKDPYEMFLSGTSALIEIKNPSAKTNKELVVFRDSFGSSIVPLLVPGYSKITVVDIRYIQSSFVGNFVEFTNQDVLFLYSTTLLNNSLALR